MTNYNPKQDGAQIRIVISEWICWLMGHDWKNIIYCHMSWYHGLKQESIHYQECERCGKTNLDGDLPTEVE